LSVIIIVIYIATTITTSIGLTAAKELRKVRHLSLVKVKQVRLAIVSSVSVAIRDFFWLAETAKGISAAVVNLAWLASVLPLFGFAWLLGLSDLHCDKRKNKKS